MSGANVAISEIMPSVVVLVAMGLVTGAIGLARARRLAGAGMKALVIARVNMVRTFRDRMSLFFILVLPMILIVVLGMTYGGMNTARIGVADLDGGPLAADLAVRRP